MDWELSQYELARIATRVLEDHGIHDVFWSYVVANRFPDLEVRRNDGRRGLRVEVKCLQTIAEEGSANFDALKKDIHPRTDFLAVFLWEWSSLQEDVHWDRAPIVRHVFFFHAYSLAELRDCYWLNRPPGNLGDGYQGYDLRYGVNCRNGVYNEEEGNYGKLLRMWQPDFPYAPADSPILHETIHQYLAFRSVAVLAGFETLAKTLLPKLTGDQDVKPFESEGVNAGWKCGEVCFVQVSFRSSKTRDRILSNLPTSTVYVFSTKYEWAKFFTGDGKIVELARGKKPKHLRPDQVAN